MKHIAERMNKLKAFFLIFFVTGNFSIHILGQHPEIKGVFPHLSVVAEHEGRSEAGIGALLPWANKLWMIGYVAHIHGNGPGLYSIDEKMDIEKHPESVTGTFANRFSRQDLNVAIIGPHLIDANGDVKTYGDLKNQRLTATMSHLTDKGKVYFLTMEGLFYEASLDDNMEVKFLFNLVDELNIPKDAQVHFKSAFTGNGRVVVANNSYYHDEHLGKRHAGRLAEWNGNVWKIIDDNPYVEVSGKNNDTYQNTMVATGWDAKSVILKSFNSVSNEWSTYRLPKGSHSFDHAWNTEWMRVREAQTERFLMDIHGIIYELPMMSYEGKIWGIKPVAYHLRLIPDYCFWRGLFVLAGDQTDHGVGQPQSNLLFMNIDDLWNMGKPTGWGSVWRNEDVEAKNPSVQFLMTGFDKKVLHITNHSAHEVTFTIEVDYTGNGTWNNYFTFLIEAGSYKYHVFPDGFSSHWVRIKTNKNCKATATFFYN